MSVTMSCRCKECNGLYKNVQIYDRKKLEREGYMCDDCKILEEYDCEYVGDDPDERINSRLEILDL